MLFATTQAFICCHSCRQISWFCPTCGEQSFAKAPLETPIPAATSDRCDCGTFITVQVAGYRPNPTGETPATRSPLSDQLPRLSQALKQPAATRTRHTGLPWEEDGPTPPPTISPDQRFSLSQWAARGWQLPAGIAPATISAAYRRAFGKNPPKRQAACLYTAAELNQALAYIRGNF